MEQRQSAAVRSVALVTSPDASLGPVGLLLDDQWSGEGDAQPISLAPGNVAGTAVAFGIDVENEIRRDDVGLIGLEQRAAFRDVFNYAVNGHEAAIVHDPAALQRP